MRTGAPTLHCVKIVPALDKANADKALERMGWGPGTHIRALSSTGMEPATHWGTCFPEYEVDAAAVDEVRKGNRPEGMPLAEAAAIGRVVNDRQPRKVTAAEGTVSFVWDHATPRDHWLAVLAARGLKEIVPLGGVA